jgi:endoglucanase
MIMQMKNLGFNAVRIPVCPATLHGAGVSSIDFAKNPDLANKNSLQILDLVVNEFNKQGFYILLDHHRPDCNVISELWTTNGYSETNWIDDLVLMATRYKALPHFLGIDLKNEPHGLASWGTGNLATDWNSAAERAATKVLAANPKLLIYVEGIGESSQCSGTLAHWWGGNLEPLKCTPLAIAANKLVLSPHVYGPDVFNQPYFNDATFPANMPAIWNAQFGQFKTAGYTIGIGEFGGRYGHSGNAKDKIWQDALVKYLIKKGMNNNTFYWAWNPNSGDTGGVLQDDWLTPWKDKMDLLLTLWRKKGMCSDGLDNDGDGLTDYPNDPGCVSVLDNNEANPVTALTACADKLDNDNDGLIDYPYDLGCSSATDNDEFNPPSLLNTTVSIYSDWGTAYCANVSVENTGPSSEIWKVSFAVQGTISQMWNATYSQVGSTVSAQGESYNNIIAPGATLSGIGFCANR